MGSFYSIALISKGKGAQVEAAAKEVETELKANLLPTASFKLKFLGSGEYFDEYKFFTSELKNEYETSVASLSEKIDGVFAYLETSDGENSNFFLFDKGKLVVRLSNNPESLYNNSFFQNPNTVIDNQGLGKLEPFSHWPADKAKKIFNKEMADPYFEMCEALGVANPETDLE